MYYTGSRHYQCNCKLYFLKIRISKRRVMNLNKKKIIKIIKITALVLAGVVALGAVGAYVTLNYVVKPKSEQIIKAVDELLTDEDIKKAVEPYLTPGELDSMLQGADSSSTVAEAQASPEGGAAENTEKSDSEKATDNSTAAKSDKTSSAAKTEAPKKTEKKRSDYKSRYDYVKDNVPAADFSRGISLASRVDIGYVTGLLSGGLTAEEKRELKAYLTARFSGSEIAEGISLYSKYSYLLR